MILFSDRTSSFRFRLLSYLGCVKLHYRIPSNWGFYKPGLEVKFALEEAEKVGANVHFMGPTFNKTTWTRLMHETRLNLTHYLFKRAEYFGHHFWAKERAETNARVQNSTPS